MSFDAQAPAEVTARDRMMRLRDRLATLPDERFDYGFWSSEEPCGTVACIAGWQGVLMGDPVPTDNYADPAHKAWRERMAASLGLSHEGYELFVLPSDTDMFDEEENGLPTRAQAIRVIDHFLATGEIAWSVALQTAQAQLAG